MPLNKEILKQAIKSASQASKNAGSVAEAEEIFADNLATAIDAFIRSGLVQTTGTAAAQTGGVT